LARSIPDDIIKRIQDASNIVDIIGESVVLKKAGRNYQGLCPFHAEKTPSFSVSAEKEVFYCFGCQTGGDVFRFLMQHEGISFPEAVRMVASRYGIQVPDQHLSEAQKEQLTERDQLYRINEEATAYFRRTLYDPERGHRAMAYLLGRGMTRLIIDGHQLGYAPPGWDGLLKHLRSRKIAESLLVKSGLIVPRKSGNGYYDRFRDRVMFPIVDMSRQIIGFGGRVMGDELPKYLNSPETPVYSKSRSLYGIQKAKQPARASGRVYLVEGYFDVLAMHLYGLENSVATLGTSLTPEHAKRLKGMVGDGEVVLVYDSDQAGIKAAHRSIAVFEAESLRARILVLPRGDDPDTFLREHGPDAFLKAAEHALGFIPFLINSAVEKYGLTLEGKVQIVSVLQEPLAAVNDTVARSLYIQQLAERLGIDEAAIMEKVRGVAPAAEAGKIGGAVNRKALEIAGSRRIEQQMVAIMLRFPQLIPEIVARNLLECFEDPHLLKIAQAIADRGSDGGGRVAEFMSVIDDPAYKDLIAQLAMVDGHWDRGGCERLLKQFEERQQRQTQANLQRRIEQAEKNKDYKLLNELLRQKQREAGRGLMH
jgi:DNA primase